jgi:transcriptional regulator with XRE-family HTH domain
MRRYNFEFLRFLRKQHGLTIEALARKSGVSFAVISKLERNRANPSLATLEQLAKALTVSATELVSLAEFKTREIRGEERYKTDGFSFRKVSFNNAMVSLVRVKRGGKLSRPEVHQNDNEIVFVKEGRIKLLTAMGDYTLKKGDSIQFDAIFKHTYQAENDAELIVVHTRKSKTF